jgi:5-methylcytosine-specific restriction endonuclease McrA
LAGRRITPTDLEKIIARDGMRCYLCGRKVTRQTLSFDHAIPLSRGGEHSPSNLRVTHLKCNLRKSAKVIPIQQLLFPDGFGGRPVPVVAVERRFA